MVATCRDTAVLLAASARIDELISAIRDGHHAGAPLREQLPRVEELAQQYDLVGDHEAAARFRRQADALQPLRRMQDAHEGRPKRRWGRLMARRRTA